MLSFTCTFPLSLPNLSEEPSQPVLLFLRWFRRERKNVPIEQDKNTFQIMEKRQKVFGRDISYENSVPPIGAPKATLTPAEAPAAASCLLFSSVLINSKFYPGMYSTSTPQIAPICANGPSLPTQSLPRTANVTPKILVKSVGNSIKPG